MISEESWQQLMERATQLALRQRMLAGHEQEKVRVVATPWSLVRNGVDAHGWTYHALTAQEYARIFPGRVLNDAVRNAAKRLRNAPLRMPQLIVRSEDAHRYADGRESCSWPDDCPTVEKCRLGCTASLNGEQA